VTTAAVTPRKPAGISSVDAAILRPAEVQERALDEH